MLQDIPGGYQREATRGSGRLEEALGEKIVDFWCGFRWDRGLSNEPFLIMIGSVK